MTAFAGDENPREILRFADSVQNDGCGLYIKKQPELGSFVAKGFYGVKFGGLHSGEPSADNADYDQDQCGKN